MSEKFSLRELEELQNRSFLAYKRDHESEADSLLKALKSRKDALFAQLSSDTEFLSAEYDQLGEEHNQLTIQIEEIEQGIKERYRDSFADDPKKIVFVIESVLPLCTIHEFKGLLEIRKDLYKKLVEEYQGKEQPSFLSYLKKNSEENYDTFYSVITQNLFTEELEVAYHYGYKQEVEKLLDSYVSQFYKKEIPAFEKLYNNPATNALGLLPNSKMNKDPYTGELHTDIHVGSHIISFSIDAEGSLLEPAQAEKVFDAFTKKITKTVPYRASPEEILQSREQVLTVREYMDLCNLSDVKSAKAQLTKSLQWLYSVSVDWEEEVYYDFATGKRLKKPEIMHWHSRIFDSIGENKSKPIKKGRIHAKLNPDIITTLSYGFVMDYPNALFRINHNKNPNSYRLGKKLAEHKNMNIGKPNENRIAVRTLLENAPNIPSYEEVMQTSRHIKRKIIDPFERDLFALEDEYGVCKGLHYCNSNGVPLTDTQLEDYSYNEWIDWLVEFDLREYPDQTERRKEIESIREEKAKIKIKQKAKRG